MIPKTNPFPFLLLAIILCISGCGNTERIDPEAIKFFQNGMALIDSEDYDNAIQAFNRALDISPDFADAYEKRGMIWYYKRDFDKASKDYQKALEINPENVGAYNDFGVIHNDNGNYLEARECFDKALELDPGLISAYSNRAVSWKNLGAVDQAITDHDRTNAFEKIALRTEYDADPGWLG